jgi:hypothetical protein
MEVETFEIEEAVGEALGTTPEIEAEALELIESLGLEGQSKLVVRNEETGDDERIPYPEMTKAEVETYQARFPVSDKVENYSMGIIPVRVLQVVGHARGIFEEVYVWHDRVRDPDPILVGKSDKVYYLLARWGDALKSFAEVKVEAATKLREDWERKLKAKIGECQSFLASLDAKVEEKLAGEWVFLP